MKFLILVILLSACSSKPVTKLNLPMGKKFTSIEKMELAIGIASEDL